ncbi:GNAT family N-acetyltransferase [Nocardioides pocheonensis]|uniref:GNAT family N-acetyltransferase n=1 Tax=Nocardioides pocheonensis TaxID=661485 RepID=A0A3N0GVG1_9ACTN|nr:GNAT family N-acetyltransferase [Nocardioides pocheonensis]RNM16389.1 GNAT family N-acetyltransferase [Nocardioides pocheonensis]
MQLEILRAQVRDGEAWAQAADRLSPDEARPVLAVDLSGDPLRFRVDPDHVFSVRPMTAGDFPEVARWVNQPHVARWWTDFEPSGVRTTEEIAAQYGPALAGDDPTRMWVWEVNGRSVGFSQDYRISDHPEYALLSTRPDAIGVDYALGEPAFVGRGLGTSLLWVFLRDIVWPAYPDALEFFAAPDHRNVVSLRVLAKLGFVPGLWFDEPTPRGGVDTVVGCSLDVAQVIGHREVTRE